MTTGAVVFESCVVDLRGFAVPDGRLALGLGSELGTSVLSSLRLLSDFLGPGVISFALGG